MNEVNIVEKKSFVLYVDQKEMWSNLPNEQAGKLIKHIYSYVVGENVEPPDEITKLLFYQIKATLDRDHKKWEEVREARSASGKKGGRPPKAKKAKGFGGKQSEANKPVNVNANVNENGIVDKELYDVDILLKKYLANEELVMAANQKFGFSEKSGLEKRITEFNKFLKVKSHFKKTWGDYTSHFLYWQEKSKKPANSVGPTFNSPVL